jgi:endonuclease G
MYRLAAATVGLTATVSLAGYVSRPSSGDIFQEFKSNISSLFCYSEIPEGISSLLPNSGSVSITAQAKALTSESITGYDHDANVIKRRNEIMKYGYPTTDNLKVFNDHILAYSNVHKGPLWVCEHLTDDRINFNKMVNRSQSKFVPDSTVSPMFRCYNSDFLGSGFDRGHLAAAANHRQSQLAMDDTFYLSNICPQIGKGLNRSKWNELEKRARALARKHKSAYVLTGPLYLPTVIGNEKFVKYKLIGENNVAVPTHFFKVIVAKTEKGGFVLESYVMPNEEIRDDIPISSYLVPKGAIEKGAGFMIFDYIADSQYCKINGLSNPAFIK